MKKGRTLGVACVVALTGVVGLPADAQLVMGPEATRARPLDVRSGEVARRTPPNPPGGDRTPPEDGVSGDAGDQSEAVLLDRRTFFAAPHRPAYQNLVEQVESPASVGFVPGESNLVVDVTTRLRGHLHISMMSYAVANLNPVYVRFDSRMTFYRDAGGQPDLADPIGEIALRNLRCPPGMVIGVANLYYDGHSDFALPPGRIWFGVAISNIRDGDPALFGQVESDNVTIGASEGIVLDASSSPATLFRAGVVNLDRTIIPFVDCKPDWQMDGVVDVRDYAAFADDYVNRPERADYNNNGATDVQDYIRFCVEYIGCAD